MQQDVVTASQRIDQLAVDKRETNKTLDGLKFLLVVSLQNG